MRKVLLRSVVVLAALVAGTARAELVINGGFETGDFTGWSTQNAAAGSLYQVIDSFGHNSSHSVVFAALGGDHDEIFQILPTSAGEDYLLSFWVHNFGAGNDSLVVWWEGNEVLNQTPVGTELEQWVEVTVNLSATMNGSELRIGVHDAPSSVILDDVSVTPEPGTLALVGAGLLALARRRRA